MKTGSIVSCMAQLLSNKGRNVVDGEETSPNTGVLTGALEAIQQIDTTFNEVIARPNQAISNIIVVYRSTACVHLAEEGSYSLV